MGCSKPTDSRTRPSVTPIATTTHERFAPAVREAMGVTEGLARLSVGLEHPKDLIRDLERALGD